MFMKSSRVTSPTQTSRSAESHGGTSALLHMPLSANNPVVQVVRASYQTPAILPLVPRCQLQQPAVLNPVFVGSRCTSVRPAAVRQPPSAVVVPVFPRAVSPQ